jgi:flagellar biosynthetic protein FliR
MQVFTMDSLQLGFLVFARMSAFVFLIPFFSIKGIPALTKIGFSAALTALIWPGISNVVIPESLLTYSLLVIKEVLVGLILGYVSMLTFNAVRMAGEMIDIQMGFSMATVFDPQNQSRITLTGQFFYLFQILLFLAVDGPHRLLMAISYSYTLIPVMTSGLKITLVPAIFKLFIQVFSLGIRIAVPFMVVFLICDISLGIIARTVPQLNIFVISFPVKIGVGLLTMAAVIPVLATLINNIFTQMEGDLGLILRLMQ